MKNKDKRTPNCMICKWSGSGRGLFIGSIGKSICMAQADKLAENVYNNELCQDLYEIQEDES